MNDVTTKAPGGTLTSNDFNATQADLESLVTSSDQTLDPADTAGGDQEMVKKAIAGYAGAGWAYTDSGTANAHVVSIASNLEPITKYYDNLIVAYLPGNTNTSTTVTVNVETLGAKNIRIVGGGLPPVGFIVDSVVLLLKYNDSAGYFEIINGITQHDHSDVANGGPALIDFKLGTFTRDQTVASGNQAVTGVGFQPRLVIFFGNENLTDEASWGFDDGSSPRSIHDSNSGGTNHTYSTGANSIVFIDSPTANYQGLITSLDADGFTIAWTRTGAPSGTATINYLAIR